MWTLRAALTALIALPLGLLAGSVVRGAFAWSRTTVTALVLLTLLPWFVFHGRVLNALTFGAVQSQWSYPSAFDWVHAVGYIVAVSAASAAGLASMRARIALAFSPGLVFLGTLFITLPMAEQAVAEGYFRLPRPATTTFWIGTIAVTGLLLGYSRPSREGALDPPDSEPDSEPEREPARSPELQDHGGPK